MRRSWTTGWLSIVAPAICAAGMAGCSSVKSGIDPSGEHVFAPPPPPSVAVAAPSSVPPDTRYFDDPLNRVSWDDVAVLIEPRETVVPVGSEVILIAGVAGQDGYLRTNRRLEWTIAAGGVGQFVAVEKNGMCDLLLGDFNWPRIVTSTLAVGSTSRENVRLNRGTPATDDDKFVLRGQGWVSLTSPVEGTSHVTVVAPEVYSWDARTKSATVHFVDAVVQYPPPAINAVNTKHVFTTTVLRYSNQSPCENWIVRYEIVGGPPAGFGPEGSPVAEVRTNSAGQGCAEIRQLQPASGVNKIAVQVIRPADAPGAGGQRLVVGSGATTKTWSAADLQVRMAGPPTAAVGSTATYRIEFSNPGDLAANEVAAVVNVPDVLAFVSANPAAEAAGRQLRWRLGDLGPRQQRSIEMSFKAEKQGSAVVCCDATAAGGLKVRDCATTTIALTASPAAPAKPLEVLLTPAQSTATVGDKVTFAITIGNHTQTAMTPPNIHVHLDPGLAHKQANANNNLKYVLDRSLAAGESRPFSLKVDVTRPGRWNCTIQVTAANLPPVTAQAWVNAVAAGGAAAPVTPAPPAIAVSVTGPQKPVAVGKMAEFVIEVKNTGTVALQNLKVVDRYDAALDSDSNLATDGWRFVDGALVWTINSLPAGQSAPPFKVQCLCQTPAAKAYHRVSVVAADRGHVDRDAFVEIIKAEPSAPANPTPPAASPEKDLKLTAVGLFTPVRPHKEFTYEIRVTNNSTTITYRQIEVTANVPPTMKVVPLGTAAEKIDGLLVQFKAVPELPPGKSLTFRVRVLAEQVGAYRFSAAMRVAGLKESITCYADETEVRN